MGISYNLNIHQNQRNMSKTVKLVGLGLAC